MTRKQVIALNYRVNSNTQNILGKPTLCGPERQFFRLY